MISNQLIQAAIITTLKANAALIAWLTARSSGSEIRETSWQGAIFTYPAVRAEIGTQIPDGNLGTCQTILSETPFTVLSFAEGNSSLEADELAGLVNLALFGSRVSGTGFRSLLINSDGVLHATRTGERVWRAMGLYRMKMHQPT